MTIIIILSYGARYEIPIFTVEQAEAYMKEYNGDNGFCYLYTCSLNKELIGMATKTFKNTTEFCAFIEQERNEWINTIEDMNIPTYCHHINDFCLKSVFSY